jgi:hypothetical protein
MSSALRRFSEDIADGYALGPVRVVLGALLGYHALVSAEELARLGYWGDVFHASMVPDVLVPSHRLYALLLAARVCLAVMIVIGVWARPALVSSAVLGGWMLVCDRNQFHHNRYSLFLFAFLLALTPCDGAWRATDPAVPEPRTGPFWAVRLAQLQVSIIYLASGGSKLLDPDWRNGLVLGDRVARYGGQAIALGVPRGIVAALSDPDVASAVAKLAITTELVLCIALWIRPTRVVALWWGVWFHLVIQATSKVETFTVLTLAMYGLFATPDFRMRKLRYDPTRAWGKIAGAVIPLLDWLGRFETKPWEPDDHPGHSIVVIRRDGTRVTGVRAFAMLTRCVPLLFPIWAPVALFASFTRQGDLTTRG